MHLKSPTSIRDILVASAEISPQTAKAALVPTLDDIRKTKLTSDSVEQILSDIFIFIDRFSGYARTVDAQVTELVGRRVPNAQLFDKNKQPELIAEAIARLEN